MMNEQDSIKNNKIKRVYYNKSTLLSTGIHIIFRYVVFIMANSYKNYFHVDVAVERINHIPPYFIFIIFQ